MTSREFFSVLRRGGGHDLRPCGSAGFILDDEALWFSISLDGVGSIESAAVIAAASETGEEIRLPLQADARSPATHKPLAEGTLAWDMAGVVGRALLTGTARLALRTLGGDLDAAIHEVRRSGERPGLVPAGGPKP
jgi:hypothetical protein